MADATIQQLPAIADANLTAAMEFEMARAAQNSEKISDAQLARMIAMRGAWPRLAGSYYEPDGLNGDNASTGSEVVGTLYACIGFIPRDVTVSHLALRTTATVNAAGQAQVAIASVDPATMKPQTRLFQTAAFAAGTANTAFEAAITGGPISLPRGLYAWLSHASHATTFVTPNLAVGVNSMAMTTFGSSTLAGAFVTMTRSGWQATGQTFGTIPSDLTALTWTEDTASRGAKVKFKVA